MHRTIKVGHATPGTSAGCRRRRRLRRFEDAADELAFTQPGCLFATFAYEQVPDTDDLRPLISVAIEAWRSRIASKLSQAVRADRLASDTDLDSLADHVFTTFEGAFILARATGDTTHVRAQLGHLRRYLELLLGASHQAVGRATAP